MRPARGDRGAVRLERRKPREPPLRVRRDRRLRDRRAAGQRDRRGARACDQRRRPDERDHDGAAHARAGGRRDQRAGRVPRARGHLSSDLCELSARELVDGYGSRAFSPREVVDALAERIERLNPSLGAFTELCLDRARAEAEEPRPGPLAGVPFAAKDLLDADGVRTTYGSRMFAAHVPDRDAAAVAALRAAGAILIGKTQTHEFGWGITSVNDAMGSSRNPWDPSLVPGGSSGGSAVALAARMVPLALGTDTGGSVRIPAAFCGVTALKPTFGRTDARGAWPLAPSLDHVGLMARTPEDLALALSVADRRPQTADRRAALRGVAVVVGPGVPDDAIAVVEGLGARFVERALPDPARCEAVFATIQLWEAARVHEQAGLYP